MSTFSAVQMDSMEQPAWQYSRILPSEEDFSDKEGFVSSWAGQQATKPPETFFALDSFESTDSSNSGIVWFLDAVIVAQMKRLL